MRCHYCDDEAAVVADADGVRVGLCGDHFRERIAELSESESLSAIEERLDVETTE